jgi:hypothetical protein
MSIEDAYKNDALRLCSINPLDVLERVCPALSLAGFSVSDFDVKVDLSPWPTWKACADVRLKTHTEKVSSELSWIRLRNIFLKYELMTSLQGKEIKRNTWQERGMHFLGGTDLLFKIEVSPIMDLNASFL